MIDKVIDFLLSQERSKFNMQRTNIVCRCVFCGDPKSRTSANLSIKVGVEENEPIVYQCFRAECQEKGLLTVEVLQRHFRCNDMAVILELSKHNDKLSIKKGKYRQKRIRQIELVNLKNKQNQNKLKYINDRLGVELTTKDLKKLKIQLSLLDMLDINDITKYTFKKSYIDYINGNSIGFVSVFYEYVICRMLNKDSAIRYLNYPIYKNDNLDNDASKMYLIPTDIDLLSPNPTVLHLAEGPFSILGAYFNVEPYLYSDNNIYAANCGGGYFKSISTIVKRYGLTNLSVIIYSDSEIQMVKYEELYQRVKKECHIESFIVAYNKIKEDFGYSKSLIEVKYKELKKPKYKDAN